MRDPERIDRVLSKLEKYWKQNPDLRLGQIVFNMTYLANKKSVFNIEDEDLEEAIYFNTEKWSDDNSSQ